MKKEKVVFILGAGASKTAGAPLMNDFLDVSQSILRAERLYDCKEDFSLVLNVVGKLQGVHSKSDLNIQNVETVFSAIEMAQLLNVDLGIDASPDELTLAMRRVISRTIEQSIVWRVHKGEPEPPKTYLHFAMLLRKMIDNNRCPELSFITFNYDLCLDHALEYISLKYDYALQKHSPDAGVVPLLKLHGSMNWFESHENGDIKVIEPKKFIRAVDTRKSNSFYFMVNQMQQVLGINRDDWTEFLIPPTWNKSQNHKLIALVWKRAAAVLKEAEHVVVIGFSMPFSDGFFPQLYSLGTMGDRPLKTFWVFDPDPSGSVEERFKSLLGPGAKRRFEFFRLTFDEGIKQLASNWQRFVPEMNLPER